MYERFYGLRERPFRLTPDPRYLLLTDGHREALSNLEYGIRTRAGLTVILGEAGTGKTTLVRTAVARVREAANGNGSAPALICLSNPRLRRSEFLESLAAGFGLPLDVAASKTRLIQELEQRLGEGHHATLILDEAQSAPTSLLEEIRLLANIESETEKLLSVVLVGQPELADRLNQTALRQLKQRVALRCTLPALSPRETVTYIATRIQTAGGDPARIFSREAVLAVCDHAAGIPRIINIICDNAMLTGYAEEQAPIAASVVTAVCRDFELPQRGSPRSEHTPTTDAVGMSPLNGFRAYE